MLNYFILRRSNIAKLYVFILFIVWLYLVLSGIKEYVVWGQILDIQKSGLSLIELFDSRHAHFLRYSLVYPVILLSEKLSIPINLVFSIVLYLLNVIIYILMKRLCNNVDGSTRHYFFILLSLFTINILMNGRLVFAFLGISLLLYTFYFSIKLKMGSLRFTVYILLSLWLLSVSTGTFMVGIGSSIFCVFVLYWKRIRISGQILNKKLLAMCFIFVLLLPLSLQYVQKNLDYYDGELVLMLSHGYGRVFYNEYVVIIFLVLSPIAALFAYYAIHRMVKIDYLSVSIPIIVVASIVGLFGHSSFLVALPVIIVIIYLQYIRRIVLK